MVANTGEEACDVSEEKAERSEKFQRWYKENSTKFNKLRRTRYKTDPDYRKEVLERNRQYRQQQRKEKREAKLAALAPEGAGSGELFTRQRPKWKTVEMTIDGKKMVLCTVGAFARSIRVSVQAIRLWEKVGVIPAATIRGPNGERLYTIDEIEKIRSILKAKGRLPEVRTERVPKNDPRTLQLADGRKVELPVFTIGALAEKVGKTVVTVSQMEKKGYLPPTPFRGSSVGRRLYTEVMLDVVKNAFVARELSVAARAEAWKQFRATIEEGWRRAKMFGGKARLVK